jgi:hypothetical protein
MGRLSLTEFMTLDGVAQSPGRPDEDRDTPPASALVRSFADRDPNMDDPLTPAGPGPYSRARDRPRPQPHLQDTDEDLPWAS